MPYENGGFVDYNTVLTGTQTANTVVNYDDYVVHNMDQFTTTIDPGYVNFTTNRFDTGWTTHIETLDEKLEKFAEKIYMIIKEHTHIDISEEEFMKIIKDDD